MRASEKAWIGLAAGVTTYDIFCPKGETLSERVDDWLEHPVHRVIALGAIGVTAAHLANILPDRIDPFHRLTTFKG